MTSFNPDLALVQLLAVRWLGYLGLVMLLGTALFVNWVWPAGRNDRVLSRLLVYGLVVSIVSTLALPAVAGLDDVRQAFGGREGSMVLARLALLALAAGFGGEIMRTTRRHPVWVGLWCVAVVLTYVIASPAAVGPWAPVTVVATAGHLLATAAWLGGLLALVAVLLPRTTLDILDEVISRFSVVALGSVITLAVTGAVHALATAGGLGPLVSSRYGAVLFVKVVVFGVTLLLGNEGRRYAVRVAQRRAQARHLAVDTDIRVLSVAVGVEFAMALGILAVTAVLVQVAPGPAG